MSQIKFSDFELMEETLTPEQKKKREDIVLAMKKTMPHETPEQISRIFAIATAQALKESRGHDILSRKLGDMSSQRGFSMPTPQERREMEAKRKEAEEAKKPPVKESEEIEPLEESKDFVYHDELDPKLWNKGKLKSIVKKTLDKNAASFWEFLDVPKITLDDVELTGSNANFNWGPTSDIDLHLIVDMEKAVKVYGEKVVDYFNAKKQIWNTMRKISIYGSTVEVYVQDSKEPHISSGVFSLLNNKWKIEPHHNEPTIDDHAVCVKAQSFMCEIDDAIHSNKPEFFEDIMQRIKELRSTGLKSPAAEFSVENLAFKTLRNNGYLQKIQDYKSDMKDKELSLMNENMDHDYVMQSLADKDINSHVKDGNVIVHKDNVTKAKSHLKKIGHGDMKVISEGFEEIDEAKSPTDFHIKQAEKHEKLSKHHADNGAKIRTHMKNHPGDFTTTSLNGDHASRHESASKIHNDAAKAYRSGNGGDDGRIHANAAKIHSDRANKFLGGTLSVKESEEDLDEMVGHTTKSLSKELKKLGWELHNSSGGHDVYKHPSSTRNLAVPRHAGELSRPTSAKILKQAQMREEEIISFKEFIAEGEELMESIDFIHDIAKNRSMGTIKHDDGRKSKVDAFSASAISSLHKHLMKTNEPEARKIERMVKHSPERLGRVADHALKLSTVVSK